MQNTTRKIIVTGSNQGIGRGIVQNLASKSGWKIIMACRNLQAANKTKDQIKKQFQNADIVTQEVDIADEKSVDKFTEVIKSKYGSVDILFNNAAIILRGQKKFKDTFQKTLRTNFYGTVNLTDHILPYINQNGKIINMTSNFGEFSLFQKYSIIFQLKHRQKSIQKNLLFDLLKHIQDNIHNYETFDIMRDRFAYGLSKLCLNLYTQSLSHNKEIQKRNIQVYAVHPGYISTNMTNYLGQKPISEGIKTPIYLIELPNSIDPQYQGKYFYDEKIQEF